MAQKRNSKSTRSRKFRAPVVVQPRRQLIETRNPVGEVDASLNWYLVFTTPRGEAKAKLELEKAGCKTLLPSVHRVYISGRRKLEYDVATFPRYLFVSGLPSLARRISEQASGKAFSVGDAVVSSDGRPITDIRQIDGVQDVIRNGMVWAKVPSHAVAAVAAYQNDAVAPEVPKPFAAGNKVVVIDGPFTHFQATIVEVIGLRDATVLIDIFGRQTKASFDLAQIEAA
jgi:transcription antitermination factor NusG